MGAGSKFAAPNFYIMKSETENVMGDKIRDIISQLTLEEKAALCSGRDFWHTKKNERLGIPEIMVSDGPHGLRKQDQKEDNLGVNDSIKAVCFPTACALAASFDRDLVETVGKALGEECQAENVAVILGPGTNIKRSPLCGRNFEYFSEDPYLATNIAAAHIKGVQSQGVGTSLKHFCANNREFRRNSYDSRIDERAFREIYLASFEGAVKMGQPWTVMCSYNRINGDQASENKRILTDILRDEWGFEGLVVSDWGAVKDRAKCIQAGLDLEMPGNGGANDKVIVEAVQNGTLAEEDVDRCVYRILELIYKGIDNHDDSYVWDKEKHHGLSKAVATECMVLLKNDDNVLPLADSDYIEIIGGFAKKPRFQGGGSSHINCTKTDSMLYAMQGNSHVKYEPGFSADDDAYDKVLFDSAVKTAKTVDKVVIFAGLPESYEFEGGDRQHMSLPKVQNDLIDAVCKVCNKVIVVLHNGAPVEMPWIDKVQGVLEAYLAGQGSGAAVKDILYGTVNPSGRLAETFPLRLCDTPSYLDFALDSDVINYREGIFVGYRYYTTKQMPVLFPFGYGLSYTKFSYGNLKQSTTEMTDDSTMEVSVNVINEGSLTGKEVVQLYISKPETKIPRPIRELKGFDKIEVKPGQRRNVTFTLDKRSFAYYDTELGDWYTEPGEYLIQFCKNANEVILETRVTVNPANPKPVVFTENSLYKDVLCHPKAAAILYPYVMGEKPNADTEVNEVAAEAFTEVANKMMYNDSPLRNLVTFGDGSFTRTDLMNLIERLNAAMR